MSRDEKILEKLVENLHEPNRHWRNGLLKLYIHNDTEIVTEYELQLASTCKKKVREPVEKQKQNENDIKDLTDLLTV